MTIWSIAQSEAGICLDLKEMGFNQSGGNSCVVIPLLKPNQQF